jgi:hypothetical protein
MTGRKLQEPLDLPPQRLDLRAPPDELRERFHGRRDCGVAGGTVLPGRRKPPKTAEGSL